MINNDYPTGVTSEQKYQKASGKLKTAAFCVWGVALLIAGIIVFSNLAKSASYDGQINDVKAKMAGIDQKITDANKKLTDTEEEWQDLKDEYEDKLEEGLEELDAQYGDPRPSDAKYKEKQNALKNLEEKYSTSTSSDNYEEYYGSGVFGGKKGKVTKIEKEISDLESEKRNIEYKELSPLEGKKNSVGHGNFFAIAPLMFGGMIGLMLFMTSKQRHIAAYQAQSMAPVAGETMVKMSGYAGEAMSNVVDSMDKSGALDKIAKMGVKMQNKTMDEMNTTGTYDKMANANVKVTSATIDKMNETGTTEKSAEMVGKYAEKIADGIKKGMEK
ncbi:MAG: hypothetical protein LBM09_02920 [Candidatus Nomurabacteria bacterium]|nr:hypothetical protein [Candidatus Nomurabacteria bacterium]